MITIFLPLALLAVSVSAQSTTSSTGTTACTAQNILDACLGTTEGYVDLCSPSDYICLCGKYAAIVTCFSNCPNDARASGYQSQKTMYCLNASLFSTTTRTETSSAEGTASVSATTTTSETTTATTDITTTTAVSSTNTQDTTETVVTGSGSDSSEATTTSNSEGANGAAPEHVANAGRLLAAVAGLMAALL